MKVTPPVAVEAQRSRALRRANEVRHARAGTKHRIGEGQVSVSDVILSASSDLASMDVFDLLMSQPSWGRTRSLHLLQSVPLSETKTVGSMTDRQRRLLVETLTHPEP